MKAGNIKGALLEYVVRNLLKNCGFTGITPDQIYSFERGGLFFVHGKGAAHDTDIFMNPPVQMPFTYPTQVIFECKAYGPTTSLTVVRNALGMRNDLNDFEIVTRESLAKRQNNRRSNYAIETRTRYIFQVGVASVNEFSKPAVEFAANNKIPLLSLSWFLDTTTIRKFNSITEGLINSLDQADIRNVYSFLKNRTGDINAAEYSRALDFLNSQNIISDIVRVANETIKRVFVGLLETGDMVFLSARPEQEGNILGYANNLEALKAEIHWQGATPNLWTLTVYGNRNRAFRTDFDFFVPKRIFQHWKQFNLDKSAALNIKQEFFSKLFVFNRGYNLEVPFSIINIDREWLDDARAALENGE